MNKLFLKTLLYSFLVLHTFNQESLAQTQLVYQGFEGNAADTWSYMSNITPYNTPNSGSSNDIWNIISGQLTGHSGAATIVGAKTGAKYFAALDTDNTASIAALGGSADPPHILTFAVVPIANSSVEISFQLFFEGYDSTDFIYFELAYDNGSSWVSPDQRIDILALNAGANSGSNMNIWEEFKATVPAGNSHVRFRIVIQQQGNSDYLGIDDFAVTTVAAAAPSSVTVAATAFLEGAYNGNNLNTTLNASVPTAQPYSGSSFNNHSGTESAPTPAGAVDWVLVELREAPSAGAALNSTKVGSAAGFLMSDGTIKATNGTSDLIVSLTGNTGTDFYVVVYHRNHLPIISANAISESSSKYAIDFTSTSANTYQTTTALSSLSGGKFGMPAGDTDSDGDIDATDLSTWRTNNGAIFSYNGNGVSDFNLDGVINAVDKNDFYLKNKSKSRQVPSN